MFITVAQLKDIKLNEDVSVTNSINKILYRLTKDADIVFNDETKVKLSDIFDHDQSLRLFYAIVLELPNYNDTWEKIAMWNWYTIKNKSVEMDTTIRTPAEVIEIINNVQFNKLDKAGYTASDYISFAKMFYTCGSDIYRYLEHAIICGICGFADKNPYRQLDEVKAMEFQDKLRRKISELLHEGDNPNGNI